MKGPEARDKRGVEGGEERSIRKWRGVREKREDFA
jgi:hypothetical protein